MHKIPAATAPVAPQPPNNPTASPAASAFSNPASSSLTPPSSASSPLHQLRSSSTVSRSRTSLIARHLSSSSTPFTTNTMASSYTVRKVGQPHTLEHRVYIEKDGIPVSPFHDIPLFANAEQTILNMVVEIPRWTNAKLEVSCF